MPLVDEVAKPHERKDQCTRFHIWYMGMTQGINPPECGIVPKGWARFEGYVLWVAIFLPAVTGFDRGGAWRAGRSTRRSTSCWIGRWKDCKHARRVVLVRLGARRRLRHRSRRARSRRTDGGGQGPRACRVGSDARCWPPSSECESRSEETQETVHRQGFSSLSGNAAAGEATAENQDQRRVPEIDGAETA